MPDLWPSIVNGDSLLNIFWFLVLWTFYNSDSDSLCNKERDRAGDSNELSLIDGNFSITTTTFWSVSNPILDKNKYLSTFEISLIFSLITNEMVSFSNWLQQNDLCSNQKPILIKIQQIMAPFSCCCHLLINDRKLLNY